MEIGRQPYRSSGFGFCGNRKKVKPSPLVADEDLWQKFSPLPPLPGLTSNFFTVFLTTNQENSSTGFNPGNLAIETELGVGLCKYLRQNEAGEVTLMCNSTDQTELVRRIEKNSEVEESGGILNQVWEPLVGEVDVTVLVLLSVNGRISQRNLLEVVQSSFRNSRYGMVIIANDTVTENVSEPLWQEFLDHLADNQLSMRSLQILCKKHNFLTDGITSSEDLRVSSPSGGCANPCGRMDCGHECPFLCHAKDVDHMEEYRCERVCGRNCRLDHPCMKECWEDCGDCFYIINFSDVCVHRRIVNKKIICCEEHVQRCKIKMSKQLACGHMLEYHCSNPPPPDSVCNWNITRTFQCGHKSTLTCPEVARLGENWRCEQSCKQKLSCGHTCGRPCHLDDPDHQTTQCMEVCEKVCMRRIHKCLLKDHLCGEPCPTDHCNQPFDYRLHCRHSVKIQCSDPDVDEESYKCMERCQIILPFCRHWCTKLCWEECGFCEEPVMIRLRSCPRYHIIVRKCQDREGGCDAEVKVRANPDSSCGHLVSLKCFEVDTITTEQLTRRCVEKCVAIFTGESECGHACSGDCRTCYQGRFHARCEQPCEKILICGHRCRIPCGLVCPPCSLPCESSCEHKPCQFECGVPCTWECEEPCSYACQHSSCTKKCSEICDKAPCFEQCPNILKCGHRCIGYCGEECPPYCKVCDKEQVAAGMELFSGSPEVGDEDRLIQLNDCGHCVEGEGLEHWLKVSSTSRQVLPLRCPICLTPLKIIRRFSSLFHQNRELTNAVRKNTFGSLDEIEKILKRTGERIKKFCGGRKGTLFKLDYQNAIMEELEGPRFIPSGERAEALSMYLEKARFLEWLAGEFMDVFQVVERFSGLPGPIRLHYRSKWEEYLRRIFSEMRIWPLHPNEMENIRRERIRLDDSTRLYSKLLGSAPEMTRLMLTKSTGKEQFASAQIELWKRKYYCNEIRGSFLRRLAGLDHAGNTTLSITDEERQEITIAFGGRAGRWFKCPNGHLYVITECGGPMEVGNCPECRCPIGGTHHRLLENNYLGVEMDHADEPLYPNALARDPDNN